MPTFFFYALLGCLVILEDARESDGIAPLLRSSVFPPRKIRICLRRECFQLLMLFSVYVLVSFIFLCWPVGLVSFPKSVSYKLFASLGDDLRPSWQSFRGIL